MSTLMSHAMVRSYVHLWAVPHLCSVARPSLTSCRLFLTSTGGVEGRGGLAAIGFDQVVYCLHVTFDQ